MPPMVGMVAGLSVLVAFGATYAGFAAGFPVTQAAAVFFYLVFTLTDYLAVDDIPVGFMIIRCLIKAYPFMALGACFGLSHSRVTLKT